MKTETILMAAHHNIVEATAWAMRAGTLTPLAKSVDETRGKIDQMISDAVEGNDVSPHDALALLAQAAYLYGKAASGN